MNINLTQKGLYCLPLLLLLCHKEMMSDRKEREDLLCQHSGRSGDPLSIRQLKVSISIPQLCLVSEWKVHQENDRNSAIPATEHRTPRKGKPNFIDQKTLYDNKRTFVASRVLDPSPAHPVRCTSLINRHNRITNLMNDNNQLDSFRSMIIQSFYKTPAYPPPISDNKYPIVRKGSLYYHLVESLKRQKPKQEEIDIQVSLLKPVTCQFREGFDREYCDILGPVSCSRCIERTNRHLANEIQKGIFPEIEVTLNSLVVPSMYKAMRTSHTVLVRKKRLHELSKLDQSFLLRRRETPLRPSALHRLTTQSTKLPSFSSSDQFPNWTSSFMSSRNITSLTIESSVF